VTTRKNGSGSPLDRVIEELPERFLAPVVRTEGGTMTGLRDYIADLTAHLRTALNQENPPTVAVMAELGIAPSEWYRAILTCQENAR
jgi:hypothetical protein